MKILFFHGGPGLNAQPERQMLTQIFKNNGFELLCWDEPSSQRPTGRNCESKDAFSEYLGTAEYFLQMHHERTPLLIIGHSIGAQVVTFLAKKYPDKIKHIITIASNFCSYKSDLNTIRLMADDFDSLKDDRSAELTNILAKLTKDFDINTETGFKLAIQNPAFFNHYWHNKDKMANFLSYYTGEYALDLPGYIAVRKSWMELPMGKSPVPISAIYGKHEAIVSNDDEIAALYNHYSSPRVYEFTQSAHYPHIEETEKFMYLLSQQFPFSDPAI